tara:strand:+ start:382 stop:1182 length:801 start_codon:yes stop_codon:yes gene_type:complete
MCVLLLDGYNLLYRARSGFKGGDHPIVFNFFRGIRPIVEKFSPEKIYFVLEGVPRQRLESQESYKGNRTYHDRDEFQRQKREIIKILKEDFPVEVVRHPDFECDDVIAYLATEKHRDKKCVVVSSDTDFIQLYNQRENLTIFNPVRKKIVDKPDFDYVTWKALCGDKSDNIAGFPGVGEKTAEKLTRNKDQLSAFLSEGAEREEKFSHNISMIKFHDIRNHTEQIESWKEKQNWENIRSSFQEMGFKLMLKPSTWEKYVSTFSRSA